MSLEDLKTKIENYFDVKPNKIQIKTTNKGSKVLVIQYCLRCYYDEINKIFYGETQHWWLNSIQRYMFYIPEEQINWLFKRLEKLDNSLGLRKDND